MGVSILIVSCLGGFSSVSICLALNPTPLGRGHPLQALQGKSCQPSETQEPKDQSTAGESRSKCLISPLRQKIL